MISLQPDSPPKLERQAKVIILGPASIYQESLVYLIKKEVCGSCAIAGDADELRVEVAGGAKHNVLPIDASEIDFEDSLDESVALAERESVSLAVALFNMMMGRSLEKRAFMRGASGFFYRQDTMQVFLKGMDSLLHGEAWIPRRLLAELTMRGGRSGASAGADGDHSLTRRELDVLALLSGGASNEEIGEKLCISPHTVKTHIYNVFKKLRVPNRLQAALWAEKNL